MFVIPHNSLSFLPSNFLLGSQVKRCISKEIACLNQHPFNCAVTVSQIIPFHRILSFFEIIILIFNLKLHLRLSYQTYKLRTSSWVAPE